MQQTGCPAIYSGGGEFGFREANIVCVEVWMNRGVGSVFVGWIRRQAFWFRGWA